MPSPLPPGYSANDTALAQELLNLVNWARPMPYLAAARPGGPQQQPRAGRTPPDSRPGTTGGQAAAAYRLDPVHRSRGQFGQAASWFLASLSDPEPFHIHNELQFTRCSEALLPELVGPARWLANSSPSEPWCASCSPTT